MAPCLQEAEDFVFRPNLCTQMEKFKTIQEQGQNMNQQATCSQGQLQNCHDMNKRNIRLQPYTHAGYGPMARGT